MKYYSPYIKVLLVEESSSTARQIRDLLGKDSPLPASTLFPEILHAKRIELGLAYLAEMQFDIILMNLALPEGQGKDAFRHIQEAAPTTPIVILCNREDEETAVDLLQRGAQGYLFKDQFDANIMASMLRAAIAQKQYRYNFNQMKEALESSESSSRIMMEQSADGIIIVSENDLICFANSVAERLLSSNQDQLVGNPFEVSLPLTEGTQINIQQKDGNTAVIEARKVKIKWEGNNAYLISLRNITERQQTKRELALKAGELERRNSELDAFAQTTAHQIQGLLGQMIGYTSYLEMHYGPSLDEEAQDVLRRVLRSGNKMNNVLSELLLLAYVDKNDIPMIPLDMGRIVSEVRKRLSFQIEEFQGKVSLPNSWPVVLGYDSWIEEVWVNYIGNGLKYGGQPPHLELGVDEENNGMVRFWVKDNGPGIPDIDQAHLFKPHTRLRQMTVKGEGLGLSIVQRIVTKFGGTVGVESKPGNGSVFWFTLPVANDIGKHDSQ